jgi:hypothetical protein
MQGFPWRKSLLLASVGPAVPSDNRPTGWLISSSQLMRGRPQTRADELGGRTDMRRDRHRDLDRRFGTKTTTRKKSWGAPNPDRRGRSLRS